MNKSMHEPGKHHRAGAANGIGPVVGWLLLNAAVLLAIAGIA